MTAQNPNYYDINYMNSINKHNTPQTHTKSMPMGTNQNYSNIPQNNPMHYEKNVVQQRGNTIKEHN